MPTVSLKTVYQTLAELVELEEIQAFDLGLGATRFDPNGHSHQHFVCVQCAVVQDVDIELPGVIEQAQAEGGFSVASMELTLRGLCRQCLAGMSAQSGV